MLSVIELYQDVARDSANQDENGVLSFEMFNRLSRRAELRLLDYLSGDVENVKPPVPYLSQKNKDWLSPLIVRKPDQAVKGVITRPDNYYQFENLARIGRVQPTDCDEEEEVVDTGDTPIEMMDGQQFDERCDTYIEELKPSFEKPIAKMVGNEFQFMPKDIGSVRLEYIRYPIFAEIKTKHDPIYNEDVADSATSVNYEWGEFAREYFIFFITQAFAEHTRERALQEANQLTAKSVRG